LDEQQLIKRCQRFDRRAQQSIYDRYAPVMMGVCRRYARDRMDAENVLSEGFFKAFTKIGQYSFKGSFEGWLRKIMVNEALAFLRRRHDFNVALEASNLQIAAHPDSDPAAELEAKSILELLDHLPTGYRTVFNLYAIEGYKHKEIAGRLGISINTSKSQLIKARKRLQVMLNEEKSKTG
jgi:RNA polymerase sigma-70 factor (ECF subfamily)